MITMDEIFTLHWNEYQSNLNSSFKRLRNDTSYKDVTLVADDQKIVTAHKLILSMCSGYFQNVLSKYSNEKPILCLDGISSNELNNILDYIYNGEMQVHHANIERYLQLAKKLQLQGLIELGLDDIFEKGAVIPMTNGNIQDGNRVKNTYYRNKNDQIVNGLGYIVVNEEDALSRKKIVTQNQITRNSIIEFQTGVPLDEQIDQIVTEIPGGNGISLWRCDICHKTSIKKNLMEHAEVHFYGLSFPCPNYGCSQEFKTRNNLRVHKNYRCRARPNKTIKPEL